MKIFTSGSCRILQLYNELKNIVFVHSLPETYMTKIHNIKQHIQFILFIKKQIDLPQDIIGQFIELFSNKQKCKNLKYSLSESFEKINKVNTNFDDCDIYIFEVSSLKIFEMNGFQIQEDLAWKKLNSEKITNSVQNSNDLLKDLEILHSLISPAKKIIFQCHFRPNIIYGDNKLAVANREIIYETLIHFSKMHKNVFIIDPSIFLQENIDCYDGNLHFTSIGNVKYAEYLYQNFILTCQF